MIEIAIAYPREPIYEDISRFAQEIYLKEYGAQTSPSPDLFAYAIMENRIVGCLGLYRAQTNKLLLFETYTANAYQRLSGGSKQDRNELAELGTRVVQLPTATSRSGEVSIALTAVLISAAYQLGIRYVGFTTTRLVKRITDALGFTLINLGAPDLSSKDLAFRQNWEKFFQFPQICAGFSISSLDGCEAALLRLRNRDIFVRNIGS